MMVVIFMMLSFKVTGLQNEGIKPVQDKGAKRKADSNGEEYVFHVVFLVTGCCASCFSISLWGASNVSSFNPQLVHS